MSAADKISQATVSDIADVSIGQRSCQTRQVSRYVSRLLAEAREKMMWSAKISKDGSADRKPTMNFMPLR